MDRVQESSRAFHRRCHHRGARVGRAAGTQRRLGTHVVSGAAAGSAAANRLCRDDDGVRAARPCRLPTLRACMPACAASRPTADPIAPPISSCSISRPFMPMFGRSVRCSMISSTQRGCRPRGFKAPCRRQGRKPRPWRHSTECAVSSNARRSRRPSPRLRRSTGACQIVAHVAFAASLESAMRSGTA